jgi:hypothetical protein
MHLLRSASETSSLLRRLAQIALRLDIAFQRRNRVFEYSRDPQCMFRGQVDRARRGVTLSDGSVIRKGDKLINIHLWNENVPVMPPEGPTFAWARRLGSSFDFSLRQLADYVARHPELHDVAAIRAEAAVATSTREVQLLRVMGHFGFETVAEQPPTWGQRLHQYGENLFGLLLVLAVNPVAARISILWRVRSQVLLPRKLFNQRYGAPAEAVRSAQHRRGEKTPLKSRRAKSIPVSAA